MAKQPAKISGAICRENDCHYCCSETEMPLTLEEISRISTYTNLDYREFTTQKDGLIVLRNVERRGKRVCYFLKDGLCSIYKQRPRGCCLYPVIWDFDHDKMILDPECPYHQEFKTPKKHVETELLEHIRELMERKL